MINRIFLPAIFFVAIFAGSWYALSKVDWMHIFRVEKISNSTEEKLGDFYWEYFSQTERENHSRIISDPIDTIVTKICEANDIDRNTIKLHILESDEINAFALPNGHLVVLTGLIKASENAAEIAGVLGHELAHIQKGHVMKKMIKEMGLSALISIAAGNGGGKIIKEAAKLLSSAAYDRKLEKEADLTSVSFLEKTNIDPEPFANFLFRLSKEAPEGSAYLNWISTHPDSEERAKYILTSIKPDKKQFKPILADSIWNSLQEAVKKPEGE